MANTAQTNRLRALLLGGDDTERDIARVTLTDPVLVVVARRREPREASREQAVRHGEIRRLAVAVRAGRHALAANRAQLQTIVDEMAPGLTERRGVGAVTAAQAIVSFSHADGAEATPRSLRCRAPVHCRPAAARPFGIGSTAAATGP